MCLKHPRTMACWLVHLFTIKLKVTSFKEYKKLYPHILGIQIRKYLDFEERNNKTAIKSNIALENNH
ncbi:hypothetical protein BpHYR1_049708 [Brachionus plicatilis]|uniref:Uncharacterized protein n=1 Tax=Brachionus plicatilis TaxID=10195 RepID=A0A3M7QK46_BRAPC|nr:hypothetical protein BpHYR1_049708 [Brachionus plicatilis]